MRTNTSWAVVGNVVYAGCQWAVLILLIKTLPAAEVGDFAYGLAVTGPIFVLANVRLRNLLATGVGTADDFIDYLSARLLTTALAVAASLTVAILSTSGGQPLAIIALVSAAKASDAVSDISHGMFQRELDMRSAAAGLALNGVISLTLVAISLMVWHSLAAAAIANAAGSLTALVAWDLPRALGASRQSPARSRSRLMASYTLIKRALPLGLSSALSTIRLYVPRYVIAAYLGPASLAVFTALAYIPMLGDLLVNATAQAALPVLARDFRADATIYQTRLKRLVGAGVLLGACSLAATLLVGRPFLAWIYSVDYARHVDVLLWVMLAGAVSYGFVFLGTGSTARLRFGAQLLISCSSLTVVAVLAVPLVLRNGLTGAAYCLVAGAMVEACAYTVLTLRDLNRRDDLLRVMAPAGVPGARS
jgi:O-antigen/teichoic acid export membrane protein